MMSADTTTNPTTAEARLRAMAWAALGLATFVGSFGAMALLLMLGRLAFPDTIPVSPMIIIVGSLTLAAYVVVLFPESRSRAK